MFLETESPLFPVKIYFDDLFFLKFYNEYVDGTLKCCGTSLFLKTTFGQGYVLTLIKKGRTAIIFLDLSKSSAT